MVLLLAGFQFGLAKQQPIGILQYEKIGGPDSNVSFTERSHPEQCGFDTP
jgi:hypothetical protein